MNSVHRKRRSFAPFWLMACAVLFTSPALVQCMPAQVNCAPADGDCNPALTLLGLAPATVIVVGSDNGTIWFSKDGGANFQSIVPGDGTASYDRIKILSQDSILLGGLTSAGYLTFSTDLENSWTPGYVSSNGGASIQGLAVANDGTLAGCSSNSSTGTDLHYYDPATGWNGTPIIANNPGTCFFYGGTYYVAVSFSTNYLHSRQSDGSFSVAHTNGAQPTVPDAVVVGDLVVLMDTANNQAVVGTGGGSSWQSFPMPGANGCSRVTYGSGLFAALCTGANGIMVSDDNGATWVFRGPNVSSIVTTPFDLSYAAGLFYLVGTDGGGAAVAFSSPDLVTWVPIMSQSGFQGRSIEAGTFLNALVR